MISISLFASGSGSNVEKIFNYFKDHPKIKVDSLFCNNDKLAQKIIEFGLKNNDPVWRLPLWEGYKHLIESNVADLSSTGSTPFGGAITAALFLENFIEGDIPWAHIDLMAYNTRARPGRPEGGEAQAIRGLYAMLKAKFG